MADYIITGPDGVKYKASAPDDDSLREAIDKHFNAVEQQPAPSAAGAPTEPDVPVAPKPPEPSIWDRVVSGAKTAGNVAKTAYDYANHAAHGAAEGVMDVVGLPGTLGHASPGGAVSMPGLGDNFGRVGPLILPTGEGLKKGANAVNNAVADLFGVSHPEGPQTVGQRFAHRVGEEVGAAAVPVGGAMAEGARIGIPAARAAVEAAKEAPTAFGRFVSRVPAEMVESAAVAPGKFAGKEAGAATAAGTGAAGVNIATGADENRAEGKPLTLFQKLGDLGGSLGGVGTFAVGKKGIDVIKHVTGAFTNSSPKVDNVIRDVAVDEIARHAGLTPNKAGVIDTDPLAKAVNDAAAGPRPSDVVPNFQESTADLLKNPGMAAMEYGRQTGPNVGSFVARRNDNVKAVDTAMGEFEPQAQPGAFSDELKTQRDIKLNQAAADRAAAEDTAATAVAPLQAPPGTTPAMRGDTIRGQLEAARDTAREATESAYANTPSNQSLVNGGGLKSSLDSVSDTLTEAEKRLVPKGLIDRVAALGQPVETGLVDEAGSAITRDPQVVLKQATDLRSELQRLKAAAAADPRAEQGGRNAARVLGRYSDVVDRFIQSQMTGDERAALATARNARFEEGEQFGRRGDPVADILARNEGGQAKMLDANVANLSTRDDVMARIFEQADTPETRAAIKDQLLSNIKDSGTAKGLHDFQQRFGPQIARFPGLDGELGAAIRARVSEGTARGAESGLIKDIGHEGSGPVANYLRYGNENAHKAMSAVLADKDPARAADDLLNFVNNDTKAVEGARKVFWNIMQQKTRSAGSTTKTTEGIQPYLPAALDKFTKDPATAAVAERLYRDNPEQWDNIKKISQVMQGVDVRNSGKVANSSGTPQGLQSSMPSPEALQSRIFAVERGVVSPLYAGLNVVSIMARKAMRNQNVAAVNTAIDKALLEPDFAALLLKENNPANRAALRRATKGWKGQAASQFFSMIDPNDDKDADTKSAVMQK
jgi:hypothetical protein